MVAENLVTPADLILPLFVTEGKDEAVPVASMPGVVRHSVDRIAQAAGEAKSLSIPAVALFPMTPEERKDDEGSEAINPDNLVCRAIAAIKSAHPDLGVICDAALDPYTSHGHDGVIRNDYVDNDDTLEILANQSVVQARAGCDVDCAIRHDGWPGRRHSRCPRPGGLSGRQDHGLFRQICFGVLWAVPRCCRLVFKSERRQENLPNGSGKRG